MLCAGRIFLPLVCLVAVDRAALAQPEKIVTLRMLDGKTGNPIATSNFLVRMNHEETAHGDWVRLNEDGTGRLQLPAGATEILVQATYDAATLTYVNCDAGKERGAAEGARTAERWYGVKKIVAEGVVTPNHCVGKRVPQKLQVVAGPGEFVFFVRPMRAMEEMRE